MALFVEAASAHFPDARTTIAGPREVNVSIGGQDYVCYLDNLWMEICNTPRTRVEACNRRLESLAGIVASGRKEKTRIPLTRIVPVIKNETFLRQDVAMPLIREPFVADLWIVYALDEPGRVRFLTHADLEGTGVTPVDLLPLGKQNLRSILPGFTRVGTGPVYMIEADGTYEASLLLLDEVWQEEEGEIVAVVPTRDTLLFTRTDVAGGIEEITSILRKNRGRWTYPVSEKLLVRRNEAWQLWRRPETRKE